MLNFISFLIIIIASVFCIKNNIMLNQLLNIGSLILTAYILSRMTCFFNIPSVVAYIIAGIIVGYHGLGLVSSSFIKEISLIENIILMILISNTVRFILKEQSLKMFSRYFLTGAISSLLIFILTLGFFAPLHIPIQTKIIMCLFSATFSPLMISAFNGNKSVKPYIQLSLGGFFFAVILWGIFTAFTGLAFTGRIKLAFMPFFLSVTSIVAGLVWGYIAEKMLYNESHKLKSLYPLAVMFLPYPLVNELGFDFIFLAIGIGVYNGIFSEREKSIIEQSDISALLIFGIFGMHLSLDDAILLGNANWSLVAIFVSFFIFSKIICTRLALHFISHEKKQLPSIIHIIPCGPMALIVLRRFIPEFNSQLTGDIEITAMYSILTTSILVIFILFSIHYMLFRPYKDTNIVSE
ncbi:MAG TPA: hypothetical protein ENH82_05125 [bacterium]|nr:hypothetical protein [bacterium]